MVGTHDLTSFELVHDKLVDLSLFGMHHEVGGGEDPGAHYDGSECPTHELLRNCGLKADYLLFVSDYVYRVSSYKEAAEDHEQVPTHDHDGDTH